MIVLMAKRRGRGVSGPRRSPKQVTSREGREAERSDAEGKARGKTRRLEQPQAVCYFAYIQNINICWRRNRRRKLIRKRPGGGARGFSAGGLRASALAKQ